MGLIDGLSLSLDSAYRLYGASIGDTTIYRIVDAVEVYATNPRRLTIGNPTNVALDEVEDTIYVVNLALWHITSLSLIC